MKSFLALLMAAVLLAGAAPALAGWRVVSDKTVAAFGHPESVAYDPAGKVFYMSNFGPQLKPTQADGQGFISKLDLAGKVLDKKFLPGPGQSLNRPKGVWAADGRLWTTDIDSVWCFDLAGKKGKRLALPGAIFANDVTVAGGKLYVSDMEAGKIYLVAPADFLAAAPQVRVMLSPPGFHPNGLWPRPGGGVIIATTRDLGGPGGLFKARDVGQVSKIRGGLGGLDGVALLPGGAILYTDWTTGGLYVLEGGAPPVKLAGGFKGPADFALAPRGKGFLVAVPDLVTGQLRLITIAK
jgi:sugar lactone lactonase YvrE